MPLYEFSCSTCGQTFEKKYHSTQINPTSIAYPGIGMRIKYILNRRSYSRAAVFTSRTIIPLRMAIQASPDEIFLDKRLLLPYTHPDN
jgi:hypothetical protein